ncbi:MAG: hypothetical protein RJB13_2113 [Pseudomonadota bacterium]
MTVVVGCFGCDSPSTNNADAPECTVTLTRTDSQPLAITTTEILFTGEFSQNCVEQTAQKSGTTQIKLSTQSSEASESVALKKLKAGSRSIEFDPESDNLKRGSFETSFTSSLLPEWSVPWQDRPETITLSMIASPSANSNSIPVTVTVELNF